MTNYICFKCSRYHNSCPFRGLKNDKGDSVLEGMSKSCFYFKKQNKPSKMPP